MPFKFQRICPICGKEELTTISRHLSLVHGLSSFARKPWLKLSKYQTMNTVYKHLSSKTREQTKYSYPVKQPYMALKHMKKTQNTNKIKYRQLVSLHKNDVSCCWFNKFRENLLCRSLTF